MEQTYWNLQKKLHPDLYGSKSEFEQELSTANAAVVNDAYKMLKTPNTRVKYLVSWKIWYSSTGTYCSGLLALSLVEPHPQNSFVWDLKSKSISLLYMESMQWVKRRARRSIQRSSCRPWRSGRKRWMDNIHRRFVSGDLIDGLNCLVESESMKFPRFPSYKQFVRKFQMKSIKSFSVWVKFMITNMIWKQPKI